MDALRREVASLKAQKKADDKAAKDWDGLGGLVPVKCSDHVCTFPGQGAQADSPLTITRADTPQSRAAATERTPLPM